MNDLELLLARSRPAPVHAPLHQRRLDEKLRRKIRGAEPEMLNLHTYMSILAVCAFLLIGLAYLPKRELALRLPEREQVPGLPQVYSQSQGGMIQISWSEKKSASMPLDYAQLQIRREFWKSELFPEDRLSP